MVPEQSPSLYLPGQSPEGMAPEKSPVLGRHASQVNQMTPDRSASPAGSDMTDENSDEKPENEMRTALVSMQMQLELLTLAVQQIHAKLDQRDDSPRDSIHRISCGRGSLQPGSVCVLPTTDAHGRRGSCVTTATYLHNALISIDDGPPGGLGELSNLGDLSSRDGDEDGESTNPFIRENPADHLTVRKDSKATESGNVATVAKAEASGEAVDAGDGEQVHDLLLPPLPASLNPAPSFPSVPYLVIVLCNLCPNGSRLRSTARRPSVPCLALPLDPCPLVACPVPLSQPYPIDVMSSITPRPCRLAATCGTILAWPYPIGGMSSTTLSTPYPSDVMPGTTVLGSMLSVACPVRIPRPHLAGPMSPYPLGPMPCAFQRILSRPARRALAGCLALICYKLPHEKQLTEQFEEPLPQQCSRSVQCSACVALVGRR